MKQFVTQSTELVVEKANPKIKNPLPIFQIIQLIPMSKPKLKIVLNVLFHGQLRSSKKT